MSVEQTIQAKLRAALAPSHLQVLNESHRHAVPPGSESHFKLVIVSDAFAGARLVRRHQQVNRILSDELEGPVHALSMETLTPEEWDQRRGETLESPDCLGGSKFG